MNVEHILSVTRSWVGTPYRHQASCKHVGADCLGLLRGVWHDLYGVTAQMPLPYTADWAEARADDPLLEAAEKHLLRRNDLTISAGAVLLFRFRQDMPCKHCAIATSATSMIHAYDGAIVCETSIVPWWQRKLAAVFDFPEQLSE